MSFVCKTCGKNCRPTGTNAVGVEVQELSPDKGWVSVSRTYSTKCRADSHMEKMPFTTVDRRTYPVLTNTRK